MLEPHIGVTENGQLMNIIHAWICFWSFNSQASSC